MQEIINYITTQRQAGMSDEQIKAALRQAGHTEEQIAYYFSTLLTSSVERYTDQQQIVQREDGQQVVENQVRHSSVQTKDSKLLLIIYSSLAVVIGIIGLGSLIMAGWSITSSVSLDSAEETALAVDDQIEEVAVTESESDKVTEETEVLLDSLSEPDMSVQEEGDDHSIPEVVSEQHDSTAQSDWFTTNKECPAVMSGNVSITNNQATVNFDPGFDCLGQSFVNNCEQAWASTDDGENIVITSVGGQCLIGLEAEMVGGYYLCEPYQLLLSAMGITTDLYSREEFLEDFSEDFSEGMGNVLFTQALEMFQFSFASPATDITSLDSSEYCQWLQL